MPFPVFYDQLRLSVIFKFVDLEESLHRGEGSAAPTGYLIRMSARDSSSSWGLPTEEWQESLSANI